MKNNETNSAESPKEEEARKGLLSYIERIKKLDKQYSELKEDVKKAKRDRYKDAIFRLGVQLLMNENIQAFLEEELDELIEWFEIILSKF